MIRIMNKRKAYHSELRQEQLRRTREQILEGLIKAMAGGITELSIPEVSRQSGVSIPTIYRHFHTKRELVDALSGYLLTRAGLLTERMEPPASPEEWVLWVRKTFIALGDQHEMLHLVANHQLTRELAREALPTRLQVVQRAFQPVRTRFSEEAWQHLCRIVLTLSAATTRQTLVDTFDIAAAEAAESVAWAIMTLSYSQQGDSHDSIT